MQINRTTVDAGDWCVIWTRTLTLDTAVLVGSDSSTRLLERVYDYRYPTQFESWFWQMLRIPADTPPGSYGIQTLTEKVPITVRAPAKRNRITLSDINSANVYLARGYTVTLTPGEYRITNPIVMGRGSELRGYGAILTGSSNLYQNGLVALNHDCTVTGVTFNPDVAAFTAPNGVASTDNVNIRNCKFTNGHFGILNAPGLRVDRCTFDRASFVQVNDCTIVGCDFSGIGIYQHGFVTNGNAKIAMIQATFNRTDRGPTLRGASESLFAGVQCYDMNLINNGGEIGCFEGSYPVNNNLFFGWRTINCPGWFQPYDCEFKGNRIHDFVFDKGGITFAGLNDQSDNNLTDLQFENGGGLMFNYPGKTGAKNNYVERVGVLDWRVKPGNQFNAGKFYYTRPDLVGYAPVCDLSNSGLNRVRELTVEGQPIGRPAYFGVTVGD